MSESVGLTWSYSGKFFTNYRAEAAELALANLQASIGTEPAK